MNKVHEFTLQNDRNQSVKDSDLLNWRKLYPDEKADIFGPVIKYSWFINGISHEISPPKNQSWKILPDASGFIVFEKGWKPDNCLLLDAYGNERMRLVVPRQLTGGLVDSSYETGDATFVNVSAPYKNPSTGAEGKFGVAAYVEGGKFYLELDYHTGQFLWGKQIMD
jgi:hypothetical protein